MNRQDKDQIERICQILNGLRDMCIILESPGTKDIFPSIFIVIEMALEKAISLAEKIAGEEQEDR